MQSLSETTSPLPIKITKKPDIHQRVCSFEVELSRDMAGAILSFAAPFLKELADAVMRREAEEKERLAGLQSSENAKKRLSFVALKALRLARLRRSVLDDVLQEVALAHNIDARALYAEAMMLQKQRNVRLMGRRDRDIATHFLLGVSKAQLARSYDLSVHQVTQILSRELPSQEGVLSCAR